MSSRTPAPFAAGGHVVDLLGEGRHGVGYRRREADLREKGVIVLGVADAHRVVHRDPQPAERLAQPGLLRTRRSAGLITASLLKMICSSRPSRRMVSSTATSCGTTVATMILPASYGTPAARRPSRRRRRRRIDEILDPLGLRVEEDGAVLRHHQVEEIDLGTDGQDVVEAPAGDQQNPPSRIPGHPAAPALFPVRSSPRSRASHRNRRRECGTTLRHDTIASRDQKPGSGRWALGLCNLKPVDFASGGRRAVAAGVVTGENQQVVTGTISLTPRQPGGDSAPPSRAGRIGGRKRRAMIPMRQRRHDPGRSDLACSRGSPVWRV